MSISVNSPTFSPIQRAAGFTLLEVLAAISLFSLMTLGVVNALQETTKLTLRIKSRQASTFTGTLAVEKISRDLSMAYNENLRKSKSLFQGREGSQGPELTFTTLDSPLKGLFVRRASAFAIVRYKLEKNEQGTLDLFRYETLEQNFDKIDTLKGQRIATGVTKMEAEYYDFQNDQWKRDWDSKSPPLAGRFPMAVHLALETTDPSLPALEQKDHLRRFETKVLILNEKEPR